MDTDELIKAVWTDVRELRTDMKIVKEQTIKTNGRVNAAEKAIDELQENHRSLNETRTAEKIASADRRATDKRWRYDFLQRWAPVIVSVAAFILTVIVGLN